MTALVGIGRAEEGRKIFESLISLRNDVGLLSEEYDPHENRQLGNTPQAFSHFGLINAAMALELGTPSSDEPVAGA